MSPSLDSRYYQQVKWKELKKGDIVFIQGKNNGLPWIYGPHEVHNPETRELKNPAGNIFLQYQECLMKRK